jgi:hypothetical protein
VVLRQSFSLFAYCCCCCCWCRFNLTLGERLIEHLKNWLDPDTLLQAGPFQWKSGAISDAARAADAASAAAAAAAAALNVCLQHLELAGLRETNLAAFSAVLVTADSITSCTGSCFTTFFP